MAVKKNLKKADLDMSRFEELSDGDPAGLTELIELYMSKTGEQLNELKKAIVAQTAPTVARLAHSMIGANLMVGMTSLVPHLRKLEAAGEQGDLEAARPIFEEIRSEFDAIQEALRSAL
jgi:HPt (histidine-containing phosphotransfer) domain-containing protein